MIGFSGEPNGLGRVPIIPLPPSLWVLSISLAAQETWTGTLKLLPKFLKATGFLIPH